MDGGLIFFLCFISLIAFIVALLVAYKLPSFDDEPTSPGVQRATVFTIMAIVLVADLAAVIVSIT